MSWNVTPSLRHLVRPSLFDLYLYSVPICTTGLPFRYRTSASVPSSVMFRSAPFRDPLIPIVSSYVSLSFYSTYLPLWDGLSHARTARLLLTPLHCYCCASLSLSSFRFISVPSYSPLYQAPYKPLPERLRICLLYYDSILVYLYLRTLVKATVSSDLVSFVKPGH